MSGTLEATTTTAMSRTTVHAQYNGRALGVTILNNLIPIVLNVPQPGQKTFPAILMFVPAAHRHSPYKDYGVRRKCCRKVLMFNTLHYFKCYLPNTQGEIDEENGPYTYNSCRHCGTTLKDDCGHLIQVTERRRYNVDKFIYRAPAVLQSTGRNEIFEKYQEGNC